MKKVIRITIVFLSLIIAFIIYRLLTFQPIKKRTFAHVKRPLTIAHRGGLALWPENPLYAFEQAVAMGVKVLEMDVRPIADGNVVVIHDATVDRTSNGSGRIDQMTMAELKKLDFAYHFIPAGENRPTLQGQGITIPTLAEVFHNFPSTYFCIEIKSDSLEFTSQVVTLIRQWEMNERVILGSHHSNVIRTLKQTARDIALTAAAKEVYKIIVLSKIGLGCLHQPHADAFFVPVRRRGTEIITQAFVKAAHALGQEIHVWTINDSSEMRRLLRLGVDGIITDRPDILFQLMDETIKDKLLGHGTRLPKLHQNNKE